MNNKPKTYLSQYNVASKMDWTFWVCAYGLQNKWCWGK